MIEEVFIIDLHWIKDSHRGNRVPIFRNFRGDVFSRFPGCWLPNLRQSSVAIHIETSHICTENQMTGFYMKCNLELKCVKGAEKRLNKGATWNFIFYFQSRDVFRTKSSIKAEPFCENSWLSPQKFLKLKKS